MTKKELFQLFDLKTALDYYLTMNPKKRKITLELSRKMAEVLSKGLHSLAVEGIINFTYCLEKDDGTKVKVTRSFDEE